MDSEFIPDDTIAAISTPIGEGGIGIVRLSGKGALSIADRIFRSDKKKPPSSLETYTVHYGHIVSALGSKGPVILDEVLLTVMKAPKSYTKEDVVEINCHGGILPLKKVLDLVVTLGARPAEPGEFTKRAFLNGRIDLSQAEAVLDIIRSKTEIALQVALNQLEGHLSREVRALEDKLMEIYSHIEASIDFPDENMRLKTNDELAMECSKVSDAMQRLISGSDEGMVLRDGVMAVICGKPNVGKSSLLNAFLKVDRAIVTPIPGTTRDTIEEVVNIKGLPLRIVDTAGIIESKDFIERQGVERSRRYINMADIILFMLDASKPLEKEDLVIIKEIKEKKVIIIENKIDLPGRLDIEKAEWSKGKKRIQISATENRNLDLLEDAIKDMIWRGDVTHPDTVLVNNIRHKNALKKSFEALAEAAQGLRSGRTPELVAIDFNESIRHLGDIIGVNITRDVLNRIFNEFCIGK